MTDWDSMYQARRMVRAHARYEGEHSHPDAPSQAKGHADEGGEMWQRPPHDRSPNAGMSSRANVPTNQPSRHRVLLQTPQPSNNITIIVNVLDQEGAKQVISCLPDLVNSQKHANNGQRLLSAVPHAVIARPAFPAASSEGHSVYQWPRPPSPPWAQQRKRKYVYEGEHSEGKRKRAEVIEVTDDDETVAAPVHNEAPICGEDSVRRVDGEDRPPPSEGWIPAAPDVWSPIASDRRPSSVKRSESEIARRRGEEAGVFAKRVQPEAEHNRVKSPSAAIDVHLSGKVSSTPAYGYDRGVSYAPAREPPKPESKLSCSPRFIHTFLDQATPRRTATKGAHRSPRLASRSHHHASGPLGQKQPVNAPSSSQASEVERTPQAQVHAGRLYVPRFHPPQTPRSFSHPNATPYAVVGPSRAGARSAAPVRREPVNEGQPGASDPSSGRSFGLGPVNGWAGAGGSSGTGA